MTGWLLALGLPAGFIAAVAGFLFLSPLGAPVLAFFAGSKLGRALAAAGAAVLVVASLLAKARRDGAAAERAKVDRANAEAKAGRARIEAEASAEPDAALRRELEQWSPKP